MKHQNRHFIGYITCLSLTMAMPAFAEFINDIRLFENSGGGPDGIVNGGAGDGAANIAGLPASGAGTAAGLVSSGGGGADGTNRYALTSAGSDYWGQADRGAFAFDNTSPGQSGNFSAIVRSVSIAGDPAEYLANNWGRSGIEARVDVNSSSSLKVNTTRESDGDLGHDTAIAQNARPYNAGFNPNGINIADEGLGGGDNYRQYPGGGPAASAGTNTANGSVRNTAVWLNISRYNGVFYSSYAADTTGGVGVPADAAWSPTVARTIDAGSPLLGTVQIGLFNGSHDENKPVGSPTDPNTAVFDNLRVNNPVNDANFNNTLVSRGQFPVVTTRSLSLVDGNKVGGSASGKELGIGPTQGANWKVELLGAPSPGLHMDIYTGVNVNNVGANTWTSFLAGNPAPYYSGKETHDAGATTGVYWNGNYAPGWGAGGQFLGATNSQDNYSARMSGQIYLANVGTYHFRDGSDDYSFLSINGSTLIDDNNWTSVDGTANGGSPDSTFTAATPGWYDIDFRMAEGGGGDNQALYWDFLPDDANDPTAGGLNASNTGFTPNAGAGPLQLGALVPDGFLRSFESVQLSIDDTSVMSNQVFTDENGAQITLPNGDSYVRFTVNGVTTTQLFTVVPEPGSAGLFALGAAGLLLRRRRK